MDTLFAALHMDASYFVACVLVCFYAWSRFNTPSTIRSQTSQFQYLTSCATYVLSSVGLLMLLAWALGRNPDMLGLLHSGSQEALSNDIKSLDAALVAALMLTTLLPSFPVLRDFDARMLKFFHKMGAIPFGAVRWAQRLDAAAFTIRDGPLADARNYIANSKLLPDTLIAELQTDFAADHTRYRFTRNLVLYVTMCNLTHRARFGDDFPDDIAVFEKKMGRLFAQCVGFFALTGQLSRQQLDPVPESVEEFRSLTLEAYEDIRLMLARVMLYSCSNEAEVVARLADIGYALKRPVPIRMPLNLLALDVVGVIALFTASTFLASDQIPVGKAIFIGLFVAINHSIGTTFALLPKQAWSFADIRCAGERPVLAYVISGLCTLTITIPVSYAFYLLRVHLFPDSSPAIPFAAQCKWLMLPTVLSVGLAFACDDFAGRDHEPRWLRWAEGLALAALVAAAGLLVVRWLHGDQAAAHPGGHVPPLWMPVVLSASIGALFGATIPHWYRRVLLQATAREAPAAVEPSGMVVLMGAPMGARWDPRPEIGGSPVPDPPFAVDQGRSNAAATARKSAAVI